MPRADRRFELLVLREGPSFGRRWLKSAINLSAFTSNWGLLVWRTKNKDEARTTNEKQSHRSLSLRFVSSFFCWCSLVHLSLCLTCPLFLLFVCLFVCLLLCFCIFFLTVFSSSSLVVLFSSRFSGSCPAVLTFSLFWFGKSALLADPCIELRSNLRK